MTKFVEEAHQHYLTLQENSKRVIVHLPKAKSYTYESSCWDIAKSKPVRPLNTVSLQEGILEDLVQDVREFLELEPYYASIGVPHRRGFLLHGPPVQFESIEPCLHILIVFTQGTGKTSTIYALAGELGVEIYSLSLSGRGSVMSPLPLQL